jgi:hypothetical protein
MSKIKVSAQVRQNQKQKIRKVPKKIHIRQAKTDKQKRKPKDNT